MEVENSIQNVWSNITFVLAFTWFVLLFHYLYNFHFFFDYLKWGSFEGNISKCSFHLLRFINISNLISHLFFICFYFYIFIYYTLSHHFLKCSSLLVVFFFLIPGFIFCSSWYITVIFSHMFRCAWELFVWLACWAATKLCKLRVYASSWLKKAIFCYSDYGTEIHFGQLWNMFNQEHGKWCYQTPSTQASSSVPEP